MSNDDYFKLNDKYCVALDAVLMKCCSCQGYSRQSRHALTDVSGCVDDDCALFNLRKEAFNELYGDFDSYMRMLNIK